uniref:Proline-rich protein PRCC-like n=1 Tax=Phallusia mammillata TaxID=59560 RepID=A0A6F9DPM3_9ASCI|nr:proline-rich protein PRCC-like [Phallusia mammillata]
MSLGLSMYNSSSESEEDEPPVVKPIKKQTVKILVPERKYDSSDEDEPAEKRAKTSTGTKSARSGLFSKLPPPKNSIGQGKQPNRPLIPHVFSKPKKDNPIAKPVKEVESDNSDVSDNETNFFSYVEKVEVPEESASEPVKDPAVFNPTVQNILEPPPPPPPPPPPEPEVAQETQVTNSFPSSSGQWKNDEQFLRIQGKMNRKEKIEFIDINADAALEGNKELLLKSISEEKNLNRQSHKKSKDGPSAIGKRKHQMSYLIHQARARELELKNAWAAGREARKAARMRYGF